jgi:hypothetical protein
MEIFKKCDIISRAYIYIIYPSNYNVKDISTRQFYIGSTENITDTKDKFYRDLYSQNTSKKIQIMKNYMASIGINIKKDKETFEDKKFWQLRPIFIGFNCCTKPLLKALESLYIYYYYSIINDEETYIAPEYLIEEQWLHIKVYFEYIQITEHLSKCYTPFDYEDLIYDVNPYTLISKDTCNLKQYLHIYKDICDRISIPKFESFDKINFQYLIEKNAGDFYTEYHEFLRKKNPNPDPPPPPPPPKGHFSIIPKIPVSLPVEKDKLKYKCTYCDKIYNNVHWWLCDHLKQHHDINITVKEAQEYKKYLFEEYNKI